MVDKPIDAIITVREASTRLHSKCFLNIANRSILKHVIERCMRAGLNPLVATTEDDVSIIGLCQRLEVRCFEGSTEDKLVRWLGACQKFNVSSFVTVDCDDPLFEPSLSVEQHALLGDQSVDIISPDMDAFLGSNGWAFKTKALKEVCERKVSQQTEMVWKHFPGTMRVEKFDARPDPIEKDLRLTLDYIEDYWLIMTVVRELGFNCGREQIIEFFRQNPGLRVINEFRNAEWKANQENAE